MATVVKAQPGEDITSLIKRFKKAVQQEEILPTLKEKERYKKPSIRRKEKQAKIEREKRLQKSKKKK
jgi:small subunit ribosomal protein S21